MEEGLLVLDVLPAHHPLHFIPELKIISHLSTYRCWFEENIKSIYGQEEAGTWEELKTPSQEYATCLFPDVMVEI